ncbi:MAG: DUF4920 domain-containing protein [Candidatus Kapabacteria bacterium]|nr:DUF4920 domain-containing protein [Candidatus Kapabacteria bacterium]
MRLWFITIGICCLCCVGMYSTAESRKLTDTRIYGLQPTMSDVNPLHLAQALQKSNHGKPLRIKAIVQSVCKTKGCWMIISDGRNSARLIFENNNIIIPKHCGGKKIIAEGIMKETIVSEATARQYAKDGGASTKEQENIKGEQKEFTFVATSVTIL